MRKANKAPRGETLGQIGKQSSQAE